MDNSQGEKKNGALGSAAPVGIVTWKVLANAALYPTGINNKPIIEIITILFTADSTM